MKNCSDIAIEAFHRNKNKRIAKTIDKLRTRNRLQTISVIILIIGVILFIFEILNIRSCVNNQNIYDDYYNT